MVADTNVVQRLARLVVDAFEFGSGKYERDVADDLFRTLGADLTGVPAGDRAAAAASLAAAAPSAEALMSAVVRCGGRFVAMVEDIYRLLAAGRATSEGASEHFLLKREGLDLQLEISPAFIRRLRALERALRSTAVGTIDGDLLLRFLRRDDGEFYGLWPFEDFDDGVRVLDGALQLEWLAATLPSPPAELAAARAAAAGLMAAATTIVDVYLSHAAALPVDELARTVDGVDVERLVAELERARREGMLAPVAGGYAVVGLDRNHRVGLRNGEPVIVDDDEYVYGTSLAGLAQLVAMWQLGLAGTRGREELEAVIAADGLPAWLDRLRHACEDATVWLETVAFRRTGTVDLETLVERAEEYLDLPLWRGRALLYEIWILCATLRACEDWTHALHCVDGNVWTLSDRPTTAPVATLRHARDPALTLELWREPLRATAAGVRTPDVTIATRGPDPQDLVVVEAKDKYDMRLGGPSAKSALSVARRYRGSLHPRVTWVCNHCDFREGDADPAANHGDDASAIHLASRFRPGGIPATFAASLAAALPAPDALRFVLALDVTTSMRASTAELAGALGALEGEVSAVLFSDHRPGDPFVTRDVGPYPDAGALLAAIAAEPSGGGSGATAALEDAMRRCRELAAERGPLVVLVVTDARPHPAPQCPEGIDFAAEVRALLAGGSRVLVADDWPAEGADPWVGLDVRRGPLATLIG